MAGAFSSAFSSAFDVGAGGAIAGTAALTFGAGSSTLIGSGALTGSSALAFAEGSSTPVGSGTLAGAAAIVFGAGSSTLVGAGALAGSAALVFGEGSSTLTGAGPLAGTAALVFGEGSSTLTGAGALAGSTAIVFTPSGTLDQPAAGALAGSAAITFTVTGTLTGSGALAGSAAIVITPTGTLSQPGAIAGVAAFAFAVTGTMVDGGPPAASDRDFLQTGAAWLAGVLAESLEVTNHVADQWLAGVLQETCSVAAIYRRGASSCSVSATYSSAFPQPYDGAAAAEGRKVYIPSEELTFDDGVTAVVPAAGDTIEWLDELGDTLLFVLQPWGRNLTVAESLDGGITWGVTVQPSGSLTPRKTVLVGIEKPATPQTRNAFGEITSGYTAAGADIYAEVLPETSAEETDAGRKVSVRKFRVLVATPAYTIRNGWRVQVKSGDYLNRYLYVEGVAPVVGHSTETLILGRMGGA